jgi:ubiquitin
LRGGCFPAGTLVSLPGGKTKAIETISVTEKVLVLDTKKGELDSCEVMNLLSYWVNDTVKIIFEDGKSLQTTSSHPIWTKSKGWVAVEPSVTEWIEGRGWVSSNVKGPLGKLTIGDELTRSDLSSAVVSRIEVLIHEPAIQVWTLKLKRPIGKEDIQIEPFGPDDTHANFFANDILVHNGITIYIKDAKGQTFTLEVEPDFSIKTIKEHIYRLTKIVPEAQRLIFAGKCVEDGRTLADYNIQDKSTLHLVTDMGIAAGGKMKQKIYQDKHDIGLWDNTVIGRVFIHLADSLLWRTITGNLMPPTPVSVKSYTQAGFPWFNLWDEEMKHVAPSDILAGVKSFQELVRVSPRST